MGIQKSEAETKKTLLIEFLKQKESFNIDDLCATLQVSKTTPYLLLNNGYLSKISGKIFIATDKIDSLTPDIYGKLLYDYNKEAYAKHLAKKKKPTEVMSISDFLKSKSNNSAKELATKIFEIINPFL